jgi:tetratricopeptide (TPR) repeat protein
MSKISLRGRASWIAALVLAAAGIARTEEKAAQGLTLSVRMRELLGALEQVLPAALSEERFADPSRRAAIESSLAKLASGADRVADHGKRRDASFAFLSETLADEARRIHRRFAAGKFDEARFLLLELTEGCVACHSRLPSRSSHLSDQLLANPALRDLDVEERAKLEFTTRQFDRAIASYEKLFRDPARDPDDLELSGRIDEYLELALHVENQPERARRALQPIAKRADASESLRGSLAKWDASLADLASARPVTPSLKRAEELIRKAEGVSEKGWDRPGLVYYIAASGVLHRVLEDPKLPVVDQANAHYWLGLVESRVGRAFWLSQTSALLERSIRLAPGGPHARDALDLLRSFEVASHTGADNEEADDWNWDELIELDNLIRGAH